MLITDIPYSLVTKVMELFKNGYSKGTWKNIMNQADVYKKYVIKFGYKLLNPTANQILGYVAFLFNKFNKPGTVNNYLSGAKTYIRILGGNEKAFEHINVSIVKRGVARTAQHKVKQAKSISVKQLKKVIDVWKRKGEKGYVYTVVTLLAFFSMLRQSNLVLGADGGHSHTLMRKDVTIKQRTLRIRIRSTKTTWRPEDEFWLVVPEIPHSQYCVVRAWKNYIRSVRLGPEDTAFWRTNGSPLTPRLWLAAFRAALSRSGTQDPWAFTLHSLRRGGATACVGEGVGVEQVKRAGNWSSRAYKEYIPKKTVTVAPAALANLLGRVPLNLQPPH